jgi:asparagine synthase (glutamine-hydrolysing)
MSVNLDDHRCDVTKILGVPPQPDNNLRNVTTNGSPIRSAPAERGQTPSIADVPLGVFLSGGRFSSILWALRQFRSESDVKCFTVGFDESSFDETEYARNVANHFGCVHRVELLDLDVAKELFVEILRRMDDPISDGSLIPTFLLSRFCRREVTVALSGDGGDELLAGYDPFRAMKPAQWYSACMPRPLHQMVEKLANRLPKSDTNMSLDFKLRRTLLGLNHKAALWNPIWLSPADPRLLAEIMDVAPSAEELYSRGD